MIKQAGFTLFELMIAIAVIAILTAIGLPAYQGYIQKAALADMLQVMVPYKNSIELCVLEEGALSGCSSGSKSIPTTKATRYVTSINVNNGIISLIGRSALQGLTATITPTINSTHGHLDWARKCEATPANASLVSACKDVFRFSDNQE